MASRVNIRFVTILATVLLALFLGMAATAWFVLRKSAEEQIELGDAAMAAQDYEEAQNRYGRAISKEKANVEYYEKFRDAIAAWNPERDATYREAFYKLLGAQERIATLRQTDVEAHHDYLEAQLRLSLLSGDRASLEYLASEAERALVNFEYAEQLDDETTRRWPALRRYRAIAYKELVAAGHSIAPEKLELTLADFEAALEADPTDIRSVISLVHWHAIEADRAGDAGRPEQAARAWQKARDALEAGLAASPDHPELVITDIQLAEQIRTSQIPRVASPRQRYEQQRQIAADLAPRFDAFVDRLLNETPPEAITEQLMMRLRGVERYFRPADRNAATLRIIDRALAASPGEVSLHQMRGAIDNDYGRYDEAIEHFQKIVDAPRSPVSLEGMLADEFRVDAVSRQAAASIAQARKLLQEGERSEADEALARAAGFRDRFARLIAAGSPQLKLIDAEITFLRGNADEANRLLHEYTREAGRSERSVRLHAEVLDQLNQPGAARDEVKRLAEMSPRDWNAFFQLGRVEERLQNWDEAEKAFERAINLAPWNEEIVEHRRRMRVLIGLEQSEDPVEQAIALASRLQTPLDRRPPDPTRARQVLTQTLSSQGDDPRLIQALMRHHLLLGEREDAMRVTSEALRRNPDDESLIQLAEYTRMLLRSPDEQLEAIDAADASDELKLARRYEILRAAGRTDEAEGAIDALAKVSPDHYLVLDYQFRAALQTGDYQAADQIAQRAARANADQVGGLTFRGKLLLERGNTQEAVEALRESVARGAASVEVRRLLAIAEMRMNRPAEAIATLKLALAARPGDLPTIMQTLEVLISQRQYDEALRLAHDSKGFGGADPDFVHVWLDLEARVGSKEIALARRERIFQDRPDDQRNLISLARLYVDSRNPQAPALISNLRAAGATLPAVDLDARWRYAQGSLDDARRIYREYLEQLEPGDDDTLRGWLAFASLLSSAGDVQGAVAALSDGRDAVASDQKSQVDHALARFYSGLGRFAEAADAYQRILQSGVDDPDGRLRTSLAEALTLADKGAEAINTLDALPPDQREAAPARVVRSDAVRLLGRQREADEMLDDAIARAPNFAGGFLKRGQIALHRYNQGGEDAGTLLEDALADLTRAIELDPGLWPAYQIRAEARLRAGNVDDAVRDVDRAVAINPSLSNLRIRLLDILLQQQRYTEAGRLAQAAATAQSSDLALLQTMGDRFVDAGRQQQAIDLYNAAWNASRSPGVAARIVELSLRGQRPDLRRAREILSDSALSVEDSPMLLMLRAQLESKAGRQPQMRNDAMKSLSLVLDKPTALGYWLQQSEHLFERHTDWISFLKAARLERAPGGWGLALLGARLAQSPETVDDGLSILKTAATDAQDPAAAAAASRDLGSVCFSLGRHDEAVAAWQRALQLQPDDPALANNIAFTLADALDRPDDALPFALSAAEARPEDPSILDTLGVVQTRIGRLDEASETLQKALNAAAGRPERMAPVLLHLAQLEAERGDRGAAEDYLTRAQDALGPTPGDSYRDLITTIQSRINRL